MMAEQTFKGRTEDAEAPFLGAEFWAKGKRVTGVVERIFAVGEQQCHVLKLVTPVELEGEPLDRVSVGNSAGLRMALQAGHLTELRKGDKVSLECTGKTPSKKEGNSPRTDFEIEVTRTV
jgi:hypothetical protein